MLYLFIAAALMAAATCVFRYGAAPERVVLQILLAATLLDFVYHGLIGPSHYLKVDLGHLILDAASFLAFLWVALRANRVWPLWVTALQLQPLVVHMSMILRLPSNQMAYWLMMSAPSDLEVLIVLIGTLAHVYRKRLIGPYRDWRLI